MNEYKAKGEAPLSGYMFTKGPKDYRATGTSYLSAALRLLRQNIFYSITFREIIFRTPSFWEHRFSQIGLSKKGIWLKELCILNNCF